MHNGHSPQAIAITSRAAQWVGLLMLYEAIGLLALVNLSGL